MFKKIVLIAIPAIALIACSSIDASPEAAQVMVSPNRPPVGCKFVGQVVGNQGNFFTGGWTPNKNLEEGSMNDLKNKAAKLGGNYVQLITNRAGHTGGWVHGSGMSGQTNVTDLGNAYKCPESAVDW